MMACEKGEMPELYGYIMFGRNDTSYPDVETHPGEVYIPGREMAKRCHIVFCTSQINDGSDF